MASLEVTGPSGSLEETLLRKETCLIGRDATCDLVVSDASVSRFHAQVRRSGGGWVLVDLYSTRGIRLNGQVVREVRLADGDEIEVGPCRLRFRAGTEEESPASTGTGPRGEASSLQEALDVLGYRAESLALRAEEVDRHTTERTLRARLESVAREAGTDTRILPGDDVPAELYSLYEISRTINSIWDVRGLLGVVMDKALDVMRADRGYILFHDPVTNEMVPRVARQREGVVAAEDLVSRRIIRYVAETGRPTLVEDARTDERFGTESILRAGVRSVLATPIRRGASVQGVIYVDRVRDAAPFERRDLVFFTVFATEASFAINATRIYNEFMDGLVESARDSIITMDLAGKVVTFNRASEEILGWRAEEVRGKDYIDLVIPDERDRARGLLEDTVASGGVADIDLGFRNREGRGVPMSVSSFTFRDASGAVVGIGGIARNLSKTKALVRDLAAANERLREMDRQKSFFVNTVSHELKNPLQVIGLAAGAIATGGPLDDRQTKAVSTIQRNVRGIYEMVNDLLDLAKIEAGRLDLELASVDLGRAVEEALDTVRLTAQGRGVNLEVDAPPGALPLTADLRRLRMVVGNLVSNAIKFSSRGGQVRIEGRIEGAWAVLGVEDRGVGIPADALQTLFDPFSRVGGRRAEVPGTGLGLAIVKGVVEAHGGTIDVRSRPDEGTCFTVRLPRSMPGGIRGGGAGPVAKGARDGQ